MEQMPKIVEQRLRAMAAVGPHPDASLLTAFAEKSLSGRERGQVLEHLAHCADCREVVSLSLPESVDGQTVFHKPSKTWWASGLAVRWAALAACMVVAGALFTQRLEKQAKVASLSAPKQAPHPNVENEYALRTPITDSQNGNFAAKLETPAAPQQEHDFGRVAAAKRVPAATQTAGAMPAPAPVMKNMPNAMSQNVQARPRIAKVPPASESAEVAAAAAPSAAAVGGLERKDARADESSNNAVPRSANETVEVAAEAPAVETNGAPGKAKDAKKSLDKELQAQIASSMVTAGSGGADQLSAQGRNYDSLAVLTSPARWSLSPEGAVRRSLDAGKTWQPVPIANHVIFRAVSALGTEVWVGGLGGALYHSSDRGQTWIQVKPRAGGTPLTADITSLEFSDAQHGKLTTIDHQIWTTSDGGQNWQKQ